MSPASDGAEQPTSRIVAHMDGPVALPRSNGELVFAAPWEGRAFGLAVAMHEQGVYEWDTFRDALVAEIGHAEAAGEASTYYERWLEAFTHVLTTRGIIQPHELETRTEEFISGERDEVF